VALDSEGRGEIPSLRRGTYVLSLDASGYAPLRLAAVSVPSPTLEVALTPGGSVEVLAGPATLAAGSARAQMLTASGAPYAFSPFATDGRLTLSTPVRRLANVAPGEYVLSVEGGPSRSFTVREGGATRVELP
jgi:hypothetical protein